jgi:hypothetical protein
MTDTPAPRKRAPRKRAAKAVAAKPISEAPDVDPTPVEGKPDDTVTATLEFDEATAEQWREAFKLGPMLIAPGGISPSIHNCLLQIMDHVGVQRKTSLNRQGSGYNYRGVDQVMNALYPALLANRVTIVPQLVEKHTGSIEVGVDRRNMGWAEVTMAYTLTAPDGSSVTWIAPGAAFDAGDKAISKACSVAYRTAIIQGLCLPTDEVDPDSETYERSDNEPVNAGLAARKRAEWEAQQQANTQEQRQEQAGEENQAPQPQQEKQDENQTLAPDLAEARKVMWATAQKLGWQWRPLCNRFKADHGCEPSGSDAETVQSFTAQIVKEAEAEEDRAKELVKSELGGKEVEPQQTFESKPGSERLL